MDSSVGPTDTDSNCRLVAVAFTVAVSEFAAVAAITAAVANVTAAVAVVTVAVLTSSCC